MLLSVIDRVLFYNTLRSISVARFGQVCYTVALILGKDSPLKSDKQLPRSIKVVQKNSDNRQKTQSLFFLNDFL